MKEDAFGSPESSVNFRINAALTTTPTTVPDIIKKSGVKLKPFYKDGKFQGDQTGPVYVHLKALAADGKIARTDDGSENIKYSLYTLPSDRLAIEGPKMKPLLEQVLQQFGQIILYGPPGTGKTREAKHLALALLSGKEVNANSDDEIENQLKPFKDANRFDLVVFHPAYEYEQFVGGIEPTLKDHRVIFEAKAGVFTQLCRKAEKDKRPAVLIIDEINRGNLPKLLGELVYALEYRDHEVRLPFEADGSANLTVPKNLYIIATMNSADRSIGHIDVAIRRRFGLYPLEPNSEVVREVWSGLDKEHGKKLAALMDQINKKLHNGPDPNATAECGVGQSYFLPKPGASGEIAKKQVEMKWKYQVQPLLREYALVLNLDANSLQEFDKSLDQCLGQP